MERNTLEEIRRRDTLRCGVSRGILGMSFRDTAGVWTGFDVDFARAIAAALLGDARKIDYVSLLPSARFSTLASHEIDLLCCNATYTFARDVSLNIRFAATTCYDGETLLVRRDSALRKVSDLAGQVVAFQAGTTTQANLVRHLQHHGVKVEARHYPTPQAALDAYERGECAAYALDRIPLSGERLRLRQPDDHVLIDETFSKEPMGPAVAFDQPALRHVVFWVVNLVIEAEELGLSSDNIDEKLARDDADASYLMQLTDTHAHALGVERGWAQRVIRQVGNYGEIFDRNIGARSPLGLARGHNELWSRGGLIYAVPFK